MSRDITNDDRSAITPIALQALDRGTRVRQIRLVVALALDLQRATRAKVKGQVASRSLRGPSSVPRGALERFALEWSRAERTTPLLREREASSSLFAQTWQDGQ
jgi:hypothetical protein